MGLERLFRGRFGSDPQLDMDKQFARVRVPRPQTFDFAALADGIQRNNVGTAGITLEATVEFKEGTVVIQPTGQAFPLEGPPSAEAAPGRRRLKVHNWQEPAKTRLEVLK